MKPFATCVLAGAISGLAAGAAWSAPLCDLGYGSAASAKPNKLYLYLPAADDATYPEFGVPGLPTSPAHRFDPTELTSYTGTADELRNGVYDVVADTYCEFDVEVILTTTAPPTTFPRRDIVAAGTDPASDATPTEATYGFGDVDLGDASPTSHARVWAGSLQVRFGGPGQPLGGASSTVARWARAIGGTIAHEAGHNYGITHTEGLVTTPGEDPANHHLMASGTHYTGADRAGYRRHFSDHEYSLLAANVGLSVQTVWNWDLVNPNAGTATKLKITFLSPQPTLTLAGVYGGPLSPWTTPTVSAPVGTQVFKGTMYNRFELTWSVGQAWSGGASGQVGGGAPFHVGATFMGVDFNTPDPIIVTDVTLYDASDTALSLHPRVLAFDAGLPDSDTGAFAVDAVNLGADMLQLENVRVSQLPRLLTIDAMVPGGEARMADWMGQPFRPWRGGVFQPLKEAVLLKRGGSVLVPIARLSDPRHVVQRSEEADCTARDSELRYNSPQCPTGVTVDLFPATAVLIDATVVQPAAKHWDRSLKKYVVGPVRTRMFYQFTGRHPDLNKNGVDDYVDILTKRAVDANHDGVIDAVQRRTNDGERG